MNSFEKLSSLCSVITDGSHYSPVSVEKGIPMLSVKDMTNLGFNYDNCNYITNGEYEKMLQNGCVPQVNDVLIAKDGSYLKHVFVVEKAVDQAILSSIGILRPNCKLIDPYYLKYYLSSDFVKKQVAKKYVSGSALPRIILKNFKDIDIPMIELNEQKKISSVLKNIDDKILNNNRIISELESMSKTVYDYWFLQFEFPNENGKPYKSSGGKMVWNDELKREIPEGWRNGNLYDVADFVNGLACQKYRPKNENDDKLRVIKITEMHDGFTENTEFVSSDVPTKYIIHDGDILFSWSASLEVMLWNNGKGCLNQHIFKVNPKNYGAHYVYMQLASYVINFVKLAEARKTTMGHITTDHLKQSKICLPDSKVADLYEQKMLPLFTQITNLKQENQKLASLRDFILPMLMNGQVTFKEKD